MVIITFFSWCYRKRKKTTVNAKYVRYHRCCNSNC
jgi:hypothetical protein